MLIYIVEITYPTNTTIDSVWQSRVNADFRASTLTDKLKNSGDHKTWVKVLKKEIKDWVWSA